MPFTTILAALLTPATLCFPVAPPTAVTRPPAVPLVAQDPYMSVWSMSDRLTDDWPRHWTNVPMGMSGMVRIDGKTFRWCGPQPASIPAMEQKSLRVDATTTTYLFESGGVQLTIAFVSDVAPDDMIAASRSACNVVATSAATDGKSHEVSVYLDVSGEWVVFSPDQVISWTRLRTASGDAVSMGTISQSVLARDGDWTRIDWGRLYLSAFSNGTAQSEVAVASHDRSRDEFIHTGKLVATDDLRTPRPANDNWPVMAGRVDLATPDAKAIFTLALDDNRSIELFQRPLPPLWAYKGAGAAELLDSCRDTTGLLARTTAFSKGLRSSAEHIGPVFADLTSLAYRQVMAGNKIVADWDGSPVMFPKEITSNGCISTVDVIYPACPFFLYHNPEMLKAQLRPIMQYAASPRWKFPFAPHDLGTYPKANGQIYGGREAGEENQMPVEESGNMLIMLGALARVEKNADFSRPYLPILERWATYLAVHGLDPENQLCTDDFAGHLARNANLSAKTTVALGAYAQLLKAAGDEAGSEKWMRTAREFADKWQTLAKGENATVLVFGIKETWSQKYNLIWDRVLGLHLFPQSVFDAESALYKSKMQQYGLPLDSRKTYSKLDWTTWSACLTGRKSDFNDIMGPVYTWVNNGPTRVPLTDWYETTDGRTMGMHTRTVIGGIWMPLLMDKMGVGLK